jgi:hypothetical protein
MEQNKVNKNNRILKPALWGLFAGLSLLTIYFLILTVANSFGHAMDQFRDMWYWISILVLGFGIQATLYAHIRGVLKARKESGVATSSMAAAGGISTTSMVACCAHHVTDVLPILGLTAAVVFLGQYQDLFLMIGVLSNLIGITLMLRIIQKHGLFQGNQKVLAGMMKLNMNKSFYFVSIFSAFTILAMLYNSI